MILHDSGRFATWGEVMREHEAYVSDLDDCDRIHDTISRCNHNEFGYEYLYSTFLTLPTELRVMTTYAIGVPAIHCSISVFTV